MNDSAGNGREGEGIREHPMPSDAQSVAAWFIREVLPLEPILMHFLHRNWRNQSDIVDLRQEVYARVWSSAKKELPQHTKRFVLTTARNLIINKLRDEHVVPIEVIADVDALGAAMDAPGVDQAVIARDELRRLQGALDQLPPRCREAVVLAHVEGLAGHEIAERMNISRPTVSVHLAQGLRALTSIMYGEDIAREKKS
jgi:RNA polymerase sigma-70 factor (ECF subfamily)